MRGGVRDISKPQRPSVNFFSFPPSQHFSLFCLSFPKWLPGVRAGFSLPLSFFCQVGMQTAPFVESVPVCLNFSEDIWRSLQLVGAAPTLVTGAWNPLQGGCRLQLAALSQLHSKIWQLSCFCCVNQLLTKVSDERWLPPWLCSLWALSLECVV